MSKQRTWHRWMGGGVLVLTVVLLFMLGAGQVGVADAQNQNDWRCVTINGSQSLNVRSGPGVSYGVLAALVSGTQAEADYSRLTAGTSYNWVPVRFQSASTVKEGWAITPRLNPCPAGVEADIGGNEAPAALELSDLMPDEGESTIPGVNRDGQLDRNEIAQVARSVVLIANVQNDRIQYTGTGTITTPDGLIVTNAHVVEDAEYTAIGLLKDINDPPEFQYIADVVGYDEDVDAALLVIRTDMRGNTVDPVSLALPYIPASLGATDVFRGDALYIFGYPDIGDDYLVVTTGSVVSVENGTIQGQRMPVWYRTDAEIAPGNSGGLAVNGNGEFVGIPTFVRSEETTGGRLGGIRPAEVALMAVLSEPVIPHSADSTAVDPDSGLMPEMPVAPMSDHAANLDRIALEHGVEVGGLPGLRIRLALTLFDWQDLDAVLYANVYFAGEVMAEPLTNPDAPLRYRGPDDQVRATLTLKPCCEETGFDDLALFIPYDILGLTDPGGHELAIKVGVVALDGAWDRLLSWEYVSVQVY